MMTDALARLAEQPAAHLLSVLAGVMLGTLFYGGLWWTVRRAATFGRPALSVLGSALLRMSVALGGFYLVGRGDWLRLLLCLLGFMLARAVVTWLTRLPATGHARTGGGHRHAP